MKNFIKNKLRVGLLERVDNCPKLKITDEIRQEVMQYNSDEELLRGGGISIETLDRAAHGFSEEDVKTLIPNQLKIRWFNDLENVKWEIKQSKINPIEWAKQIDLSEPIDVDYWESEEDGFKRGF